MTARCGECGSWDKCCSSPAPVEGCGCARCAGETIKKLRARIKELEETDSVARDLLQRVVIRHGAGEWTEEQMRDWCCEYKDFKNGMPASWIQRPHDKCRHRKGEVSQRTDSDVHAREIESGLKPAADLPLPPCTELLVARKAALRAMQCWMTDGAIVQEGEYHRTREDCLADAEQYEKYHG